ncbi:hypothetical protein PV08_09209 [Exophiala spinifera]|uniref:DUF7905 domain-containing protein n=1 Tax=Exophiala spinifera TaxID=91928 RepID=A0A0D1YAH4_9EURO|nr:uncharacterized protein PV08_09209 [Exophiala spinifera]KIW11936.1 hypothetical protein PV08_09209 [Exophiala spinifera]
MSDHEGDGLDLERWEATTLPSGSVYSYATSEAGNQALVPGANSFYPPAGPRNGSRREPPDRLSSPRVFGRHAGRHPIRSFKSPAQLQCEAGNEPNGIFNLDDPWGKIRSMALKNAPVPHPQQRIMNIMNKHETYIREPTENDERLYIWGNTKQVDGTKAELSDWVQSVRLAFANSKPSSHSWTRMHALDGRTEHRLDRQNKQKALNRHLRDVSLPYPFQAALLWPKDMDIDEFQEVNEVALEELRDTYICHIAFQNTDPQHVIIETYAEKEMLKLMSRILNLIKETVSKREQVSTVSMLHLPDFEIYRDRVGLQDKDPRSDTYLPTLHGNLAPSDADYNVQRLKSHSSNRLKIKTILDSSLKRLRMSQQHVRMRVVFGELGFTLFQKPEGGAETYSFEEFKKMVTRGRTKLSLNNLPVRQGDIKDLPDVLDSMDAFSDRTETYGAFFDFAGKGYTTLRLDASFVPNAMGEVDTLEQQWLEIGEKVSMLQVSVLCFDRPDLQITLDAFPLYSNAASKPEMEKFRLNLSYEPPANGIKDIPRRRVKYPQAFSQIRRVHELTMVRWRFRRTDGIFELRRKDIYDDSTRHPSPSPIETRWHALYYYPEWDNLMGHFSTIKPGEDITWSKSVATFFPESDRSGSALPKGFKNFMTEVEEIQGLLGEAISKLAKGKMKADSSHGDEQARDGI